MSRHGPPGRRSGPRHGSRLNVDIATDAASVPLTPDERQQARGGDVVRLPRLNLRRRTELQRVLAAVPISVSYAAGIASVLLAYGHSPRVRRAEIERLRWGWHALVDDAVAHALEDVAS